MNYEEKYKKALEDMRVIYPNLHGDAKLAVEHAFPELAESEDERIRKALIEVFKKKLERGFEWVEYGIPNRSVLDWLEKQKEQKPEDYNEYKMLIDGAREDGKIKGRKEVIDHPEEYGLTEQKPKQSDEEKEYVKTLKGLVSDFVRSSGGGIVDTAYYQGVCDWLDGRHIEQKPSEWSDEDEIRLTNTLIMLKEYAIHHYSKDDVEKSVDWLENRVKFLRPQPKQEWSEEDERMFSRCIKSIETSKQFADSGTLKAAKDKEIAWLKSLPLNLKKKNEDVAKLCSNEWSEEDKQRIAEIEFAVMQMNTQRVDTKEKCLNWLKSLKPQSQVECDTVKGIAWLEEHFFDNSHHSGRGDYGRIESDDFDSMEEMFASFRKEVCTSPQASLETQRGADESIKK